MSKLKYIQNIFLSETVCVSKYKTVPRNLKGLYFIAPDQKYVPENIYIGNCEQALEVLEKEPVMPGAVIIACEAESKEQFEPFYKDRDIIFIAIKSGQKATFNRLSAVLSMYQQWRGSFYAVQLSGEKEETLVDLAAQLGKTGVLFLNNHFELLHAAGTIDELLKEVIQSKGKNLRSSSELVFGPEGEKVRKHLIKNKAIYLCIVRGEDKNTMYLAAEGYDRNTDYPTLLIHVAKNIERMRYFRGHDQSLSKNNLNELLSDVLHGGLTDGENIKKRIEGFSPAGPHYSIAVAEFENSMSAVPYSYLMQQLMTLLPGSLITMYEGKIVALLFHEERQHGYPFDKSNMEEMLQSLDVWMGVSNSYQSYGMMATAYYMAENTLKLAKKIRNDPRHRAFLHDEYSIYHAIDLCAKQFSKDLGHSHILYLIHPAVITLTRYDAENNNNLRDVLFYYLVNNRSLVKTAAMTYMHRNTIINKLNKINELLGLDLEDGYLLQRLLFSCQALKYAEAFLNDDVLSPKK